jgi:hypothetical protein
MIDKVAACDKVGEPEAAEGETGAAAEPEQQLARRADRDIEGDREGDRYEVVLDKTAERHEEGRTQEAHSVRRSGNMADQTAEHNGLAQSLRIVDCFPGRRDRITEAQRAAPAEQRIDSVTTETACCHCGEDAHREKRH